MTKFFSLFLVIQCFISIAWIILTFGLVSEIYLGISLIILAFFNLLLTFTLFYKKLRFAGDLGGYRAYKFGFFLEAVWSIFLFYFLGFDSDLNILFWLSLTSVFSLVSLISFLD